MEPTPTSKLERARRYMLKMPLAVSGCGGHPTTFHVACTLYNGFALDEHELLTLLEEYNERLDEQWNWRELQHKVRGAMNANHQKPRGHLLGPLALETQDRHALKPVKMPERIVWKIRKPVKCKPEAP